MGLHILTAQQRCTAKTWAPEEVVLADRLSHVSLINKIDYARLHGLSLQVIANPVRRRTQERLLTMFMHMAPA